MNFDELAKNMTPDVYSRLRESIELGRWPNEVPLTKEQKALCLEAIIKFEISNDMPVHRRTGFLGQDCKSNPSPVTQNSQAELIQTETIPTPNIAVGNTETESSETSSSSNRKGSVQ